MAYSGVDLKISHSREGLHSVHRRRQIGPRCGARFAGWHAGGRMYPLEGCDFLLESACFDAEFRSIHPVFGPGARRYAGSDSDLRTIQPVTAFTCAHVDRARHSCLLATGKTGPMVSAYYCRVRVLVV